MKLNIDEKEALLHCLDNIDSWNALQKLMDSLAESYNKSVLSYNLKTGTDRELALEKARAEGIQSFIINLKNKRNKLIKEIK